MTTSGLSADTHQILVAWAETQNPYGAQAAYGPISSIPPWRSTQKFTEQANALNYRNALDFQQAGFEGAAQEPEQAARDEAHVAVTQSHQNV